MKKSLWVFLPSLALVFASCQKQAALPENMQTRHENSSIADIIRDPNTRFTISAGNGPEASRGSAGRQVKFTLLAAALGKTGLINELASSNGNFTLFAPTDEAFHAAGFASVSDIVKAPREVLTPILLYHVIGARVLSTQVPAGPNASVGTLNGASVYVTSNSNGVFINGAPVILADVNAANGVIHVIDRVLMPPAGNIVQTAVSNPDFSFLVAAVLRASQGSTNVAQLLSGNGPFTVFAPTNQAFRNAGFTSEAAIMSASPDALTPILAYHVIGARVFSADLSNGLTPSMLAGGTTLISLMNGPKIKGNSNSAPFNITATDIVTTNGVIHVIDGVLLP